MRACLVHSIQCLKMHQFDLVLKKGLAIGFPLFELYIIIPSIHVLNSNAIPKEKQLSIAE
jgi:hypothetical protein